ncbi:hypothetical protein C5167_034053 [Papaver somniferum]|uniref:Uncharacterized protein n=1 Tax=Papaver somniferum TaxID=3469 RepID=A0A4Y7KG08_PAPSO|nr:hypothetical protein C5167_034053 [Papaver somniferum]
MNMVLFSSIIPAPDKKHRGLNQQVLKNSVLILILKYNFFRRKKMDFTSICLDLELTQTLSNTKSFPYMIFP